MLSGIRAWRVPTGAPRNLHNMLQWGKGKAEGWGSTFIRKERRSDVKSSKVDVSPWWATRRWRENFLVCAPRMPSAFSHET